jgi:hypothetical protein
MEYSNIEKFKCELKLVVEKKEQLSKNEVNLKELHRGDKNDSHKKAITTKLAQRDVLNDEFKSLLKGHTYEEWLSVSKKVSSVMGRLKKNEQARKNIITALNKIPII